MAAMATDMGFTWRYVGEFGDEIYVRARISIYSVEGGDGW